MVKVRNAYPVGVPTLRNSARSSRLAVLAVVFAAGNLVSHGFGYWLIPSVLPYLQDSFVAGFAVLGFAVTLGRLAYAAGGIVAAGVLGRFSGRNVLFITIALVGAMLVLTALAHSVEVVMVALVVLGLAAPVSWAATVQLAASTPVRSRGAVMGTAASGSAVGVLINGAIVWAFPGPDSWRVGLFVAGGISFGVLIAAIATLRASDEAQAKHVRTRSTARPRVRALLAMREGRLVLGICVAVGAIAGVAGYLTVIAVSEMGTGASDAGGLLLGMGAVGVVASVGMGRLGDRWSPSLVLSGAFLFTGVGLALLAIFWSPWSLLLTGIALATLTYPVWGLLGSIAARVGPTAAGRLIALGATASAVVGAGVNFAFGIATQTGELTRLLVAISAVAGLVTAATLVSDSARWHPKTPSAHSGRSRV
jgi:predicted MFS family arabinose efflux permease